MTPAELKNEEGKCRNVTDQWHLISAARNNEWMSRQVLEAGEAMTGQIDGQQTH